MKDLLCRKTVLAVACLSLLSSGGCVQAPSSPAVGQPAEPEQPIKLRIGGALKSGYGVGGTSGAR